MQDKYKKDFCDAIRHEKTNVKKRVNDQNKHACVSSFHNSTLLSMQSEKRKKAVVTAIFTN